MGNQNQPEFDGLGDPARDFDAVAGWKRTLVRRPLLHSWSYPRRAFRETMKSRPTHLVLPLAAAWGVNQTIARAMYRGMGDRMDLSVLLATTVLIGAVGGIVMVWIFGWVWARSGRVLGGLGDAQAVRAAIAWAQAPALALLAIEALQFAVVGPELFQTRRPGLEANADIRLFYTVTLWFRALFNGSILARVVMLIAEAHGFSIVRALGTIALGLAATLVPLIVLGSWLGAS